MQNLSDQEKKVLEIMKESKQQLTPEEITAEIKKEIRAGMASTDHNNIYGEIRETWIYRQT